MHGGPPTTVARSLHSVAGPRAGVCLDHQSYVLIVAQLPDGVSGTMLGVLTALITHPANGSEHL
jgi:hypothetical protein